MWIGVHMENTNAGFSLGRLDQWLQPYFKADMEKLTNEKEKQEYILRQHRLFIWELFLAFTFPILLTEDIGLKTQEDYFLTSTQYS